MKTLAAIFLTAGVASAVNLASPIIQNGAIDPNLLANSSLALNGTDVFNSGFDPASLNLGSLNLGGLNLGSINLGDPLSLGQGILGLMNSFCLGSVVDINSLLGLGVSNELNLFLQLAQLAQLEALGFLNVGGIQQLIQSNLLFGGGFNNFNLGSNFNLGFFKRAVEEETKNLKRTRLRRNIAKRQCGDGQSVQAVQVSPAAPPAEAAPAEEQAAAPADEAAEAAPAEDANAVNEASADEENLSDFTR